MRGTFLLALAWIGACGGGGDGAGTSGPTTGGETASTSGPSTNTNTNTNTNTSAGGMATSASAGSSSTTGGGQGGGVGEASETTSGGGGNGPRPDLASILPNYFSFGYSSFSATRAWPTQVRESHGIEWNLMYWYHLVQADDTVLPARLAEAASQALVPVLTHYQLLDRGTAAGYTGDKEWDIVIQAVQDADVMRDYFENVQGLMTVAASHAGPLIFQTEPDSTTWLRQYHTDETWDGNNGEVAVADSGHPDLLDLPNTISGYAQALVRLRDLYAPDNVYMGLCEFDNENGYNPDRTVTFIESLDAEFDVLFTHHVVKYSTKDEGWWDAYSEEDQQRFLTWLSTITEATGLKYFHWQTVIGAEDYGLLPDYPSEERVSDLVAAGSIGVLFDLYSLDGPPHSQPWHGFATSPPADHPAYNSLDSFAERLAAYYEAPVPLRP